MMASIRPFIALYCAMLFLMTGMGLLNTYLGLRLSMAGVSTQMTGFVLTAYFMGLTAGAFFCRPMIREVGHIRSFTAFAAVATATAMCHGLYLSPLLWALLRFVTGVANIGLYTAVESWLNECSDDGVRGRVFSIYMVMSYLGGAVGQKLLQVGDVNTQTLFMVAGIFIVLSIIPISTFRGIHPSLPKKESLALFTICRRAPMGLMGCFVAGLMQSGFYTMGPVFAHQVGLNVSQLSWFMAAVLLGGLLLQWPVGMISDRVDRSLVLPALGLLIALISLGIVWLEAYPFHAKLAGMMGFGGFLFTLYPVAVARAHDIFDAEDVVAVSSVLLLAYGMGSIFGPMVASTVMTLSGTPYGLFYGIIATAGVFSVATLLMRRKDSVQIVPPEEQVDFVIMKETSAVALHMDPRQDVDGESGSETETEDGAHSRDEEADTEAESMSPKSVPAPGNAPVPPARPGLPMG